MRNLIALVLLTSPLVMAETYNEKVWYCHEIKSTGMIYDATWKIKSFRNERFVIKQVSESELVFPSDLFYGERCNINRVSGHISCASDVSIFNLNPTTGLATMAFVSGWVLTENSEQKVDSLNISALKCETF